MDFYAKKTTFLIQKDLQLDELDLPTENNRMEELHIQLTNVIKRLLDSDFNRLVNCMYRIDIPEEKFKAALNTPNPLLVASEIARLVIDRELQKVKLREKYNPN